MALFWGVGCRTNLWLKEVWRFSLPIEIDSLSDYLLIFPIIVARAITLFFYSPAIGYLTRLQINCTLINCVRVLFLYFSSKKWAISIILCWGFFCYNSRSFFTQSAEIICNGAHAQCATQHQSENSLDEKKNHWLI